MQEPVLGPIEIVDGVFWVGAVDWDVREFHGHHYHTARGTTYNAYLVKAEKAAGSEDKKGAELKPERLGADRFTALAMGALAATLAAMTLTLMGDRFKRTIKEVIRAREDTASSRERSELVFRQALLTVTVLAGIVVAMWLLFIVVGKEPGIWPFIPR